MIQNDVELQTLERITHFQKQVAHLRRAEADPVAYHLSAGGFLAEIDRMQRETREYFALHPSDERLRLGGANDD
jgi:hypothetical protein